jgi:hypothetical protein
MGGAADRIIGRHDGHGVTFRPEAHWRLAMMLLRKAMAAPDETKRQELERVARIALLCARMAAQQQRKNT